MQDGFQFLRKRNVALGRPASISSIWDRAEKSGPACFAVNGKRNTTFRPVHQFPSSPNCIHTNLDDRNAYWKVDLGEPYPVASITIYWRGAYFCLPGFFGPDCEGSCPVCQNKQVCSPIDGACPQAEETFSPLTPDVTQLALPIAGSVLAGSFLIGISVGVALCLRRPKDQHHQPDAREPSDAVMATEVRGDTLHHSSAHAAQTSGEGRYPPYCKASQEHVIVGQSKVHIPKKKGNSYKPFPVRQKIVSEPDDIYENDKYEEVV